MRIVKKIKAEECWIFRESKEGVEYPFKPDLQSIAEKFIVEFVPRRVGGNLYVFDNPTAYWKLISKMDLDRWVSLTIGGERGEYVNFFKRSTVAEVRNHLVTMFEPPLKESGSNALGMVDGYIPLRNGVYHMFSGQLRDHGSRFGFERGLEIDFPLAVDAEELETPHFNKFMDEICMDSGSVDQDKQKMLMEVLGVCLSGVENHKAQYILCLAGSGGNGKSVFTSLVRRLTGTCNSFLSVKELLSDYSSYPLKGSFVNIMEEQDASLGRREWSVLKSLSSGDTTVVKQKYLNDETITPTAKVLMTCNKLPSLYEDNGAIERRLRVIHLKNSFIGREDKHLLAKLNHELPGILVKAIKSYKDFMKRGYRFEDVASVSEATARHRSTGRETYKMFVDDCLELVKSTDAYVSQEYLNKTYNVWCDEVLGKSSYGREKLTRQAGNIKEYLGELALKDGLSMHDVLGANDSRHCNPFRQRMFQGKKVKGLFCVKLSEQGLRHLREHYSMSKLPLPDDIPSPFTPTSHPPHPAFRSHLRVT